MHPPQLREQAVAWHHSGTSFSQICQRLGVPRSTVCHWLYGERARRHREGTVRRIGDSRCAVCAGQPEDLDSTRYGYLLGQYLGDGHLVTSARVPVLRIYCTTEYPGIIEECVDAMRGTLAKSVQRVQKKGCVGVQAYSVHWTCLFPQHGPGRKHERKIALVDWQQQIVDERPKPFLRGLFHSDGCRVVNRVTVRGKRYAVRVPPVHVQQRVGGHHGDVRCGAGPDRRPVWRLNRRNSLSVARAPSVALLDTFIGPKG